MPRALTGWVVRRPGGRFQASIRAATGSPKRHYELFDTKAQATASCALAAANIAAGLPLPSRDAVLGEGDPSRRACIGEGAGPEPALDSRVPQFVDIRGVDGAGFLRQGGAFNR